MEKQTTIQAKQRVSRFIESDATYLKWIDSIFDLTNPIDQRKLVSVVKGLTPVELDTFDEIAMDRELEMKFREKRRAMLLAYRRQRKDSNHRLHSIADSARSE